MRNLGTTFTEIAQLDPLAADCAKDKQYAFRLQATLESAKTTCKPSLELSAPASGLQEQMRRSHINQRVEIKHFVLFAFYD